MYLHFIRSSWREACIYIYINIYMYVYIYIYIYIIYTFIYIYIILSTGLNTVLNEENLPLRIYALFTVHVRHQVAEPVRSLQGRTGGRCQGNRCRP